MIKLPTLIIAAGLGAAMLTTPVIAGEIVPQKMVTVTEVDFKGRPPFKRRTVTVPIEDVASLETPTVEKSGEYVTVTTTDFTGRPPFKRTTERLPVEDVASFEAGPLDNEEGRNPRFRGKPPYNRH